MDPPVLKLGIAVSVLPWTSLVCAKVVLFELPLELSVFVRWELECLKRNGRTGIALPQEWLEGLEWSKVLVYKVSQPQLVHEQATAATGWQRLGPLVSPWSEERFCVVKNQREL